MNATQILERELANRQKLLRLFEETKPFRKVPTALMSEISEIKLSMKALKQQQAKAMKKRHSDA